MTGVNEGFFIEEGITGWTGRVHFGPEPPPPPPPPITGRQLRMALLLEWGVFEDDISTLIAWMSDPLERDLADIQWRTSATFQRDNPLVAMIGAALGKTPAQIDAAWTRAVTL